MEIFPGITPVHCAAIESISKGIKKITGKVISQILFNFATRGMIFSRIFSGIYSRIISIKDLIFKHLRRIFKGYFDDTICNRRIKFLGLLQ